MSTSGVPNPMRPQPGSGSRRTSMLSRSPTLSSASPSNVPLFTSHFTASPTKIKKSFSISESIAESVEVADVEPARGNIAEPVIHTTKPPPPLRIVPSAPEHVSGSKYERRVFHPSDPFQSKIQNIEPLSTRFKRAPTPPGWTLYICPEGQRYFYHKEKSLLTMTNIYDPVNLKQIEAAADDLLGRLRGGPITGDASPELSEKTGFIECEDVNMSSYDDVEICLQKTEEDGEEMIGYYLASMAEQSVFWLEGVEVGLVTGWERAVITESHLEHAIRAQFWSHIEMFPNHHGLPGAVIDDLRDTFSYGLCDYITSSTSMFPYDTETITLLSKAIEKIKPNVPNGNSTFVAARLLYTIHRERFITFWGEEGARLDRHQSAFNKSIHKPRSWMFMLVSPFLFFMPLVYMNELDKLYVDDSVHYYFWRQFITGLKRDWDNSITPATVLLSANVGFLAINSIDTDSPNKSAAQITSYISAILSLFIYIVCQILSRHHRHEGHGESDKALDYITKRENRLIGLQAVAIAFSLPTALFLWSMLTFLAAMMFVFFDNTDAPTKISISVVLAVLGVMIVLLLYLERGNNVSGETSYIRLFTFLRERFNSWWDSRKPQEDEQKKTWRDWIFRREPCKRHSMADTESTYLESIASSASEK